MTINKLMNGECVYILNNSLGNSSGILSSNCFYLNPGMIKIRHNKALRFQIFGIFFSVLKTECFTPKTLKEMFTQTVQREIPYKGNAGAFPLVSIVHPVPVSDGGC